MCHYLASIYARPVVNVCLPQALDGPDGRVSFHAARYDNTINQPTDNECMILQQQFSDRDRVNH